MCVYLYFDEEVVGGFREVGYSLLVFVNKFLWEYLEKVMCMEVIIWRMVGLVGFGFVIFGLEGCFFNELWVVERVNFVEWFFVEVGEEIRKDYVRVFDRLFGWYVIRIFEDLEKVFCVEGYKWNVLKVFRRFVKYFVECDIIDFNSYEKIKNIVKFKVMGVREVFIMNEDVRIVYNEV